ncbi:MAG: NAD(P)/FAD-dependent oxidoreductase [Acidimicrobiales bacterium]
MRVKVLIIGAGIVGAACARSLARRGVTVTVIDRGAPAGATSAAGEGNLLVSDKAPGAELDLARYSLGLWASMSTELVAETSGAFASFEYQPKGGVVAASGEAEAAALGRFAEAQRRAGVDARPLSVAEARSLEPELAASITSAVHYPEDAQVQPAIATEALLASARAAGARVLAHTTFTGPLRDGAGRLVGVATSSGPLEADAVLVAAGPWSGEVARTLGATLAVGPRKGLLLVTARMRQRIWHKVYDTSYVGAVQSDERDLATSTVVESTASGTVLIGSSRQDVGFDGTIDVTVLAEIARKAIVLMPFLAEATVIRAYGGFRPFSRDHLPVIGADPDVEGLWYATGHEGAGIGLAPGTAELLAAAMLGEPTAMSLEPFAPGRPSLREVA